MYCNGIEGHSKAFSLVSAMLVLDCDSDELFVICENFLGLFVRVEWT